MLAEIELEALRYLGRTALEGLQMHSRYLRDLVNRQAPSLPRRYIHEVDVSAVQRPALSLEKETKNGDAVKSCGTTASERMRSIRFPSRSALVLCCR